MNSSPRKVILISTTIFVFGFLFGLYISLHNEKTVETRYTSVGSPFLGISECTPATNDEIRTFNTALSLFEISAKMKDQIGLNIALFNFFNYGLHRDSPNIKSHESARICKPTDVYTQVGNIITANKLLDGRLSKFHLIAIANTSNPSEYMINKVSDLAFSETYYMEYEDNPKINVDLRPMARSIIARNKSAASRLSETAYNEMSASNPLGTTAAQIAAAANYSDSLSRIEGMMSELLPANKEEIIDYDERDRLFELGYALTLAGSEAKKHDGVIREILNRKIKSFAGHFGTIPLSPKAMCDILIKINDGDRQVVSNHAFCNDEQYPYAQ